jgi:hypothetical protein
VDSLLMRWESTFPWLWGFFFFKRTKMLIYYLKGKNTFYPLMFRFFFNLAFKVKKFAMCPNQVLKNFNVANPLLESVFFYRNRPTCDARGFLRKNFPTIENLPKIVREILPEISLKKSIFKKITK